MAEDIRLVTVNPDNLEQEGFFCYKSKPKTAGYGQKHRWLNERFQEGLRIHILYEGKRSVGFIEYTPAEAAWRPIRAPGYLVIHCVWVVGRAKRKGYGSLLLERCLEDARQSGARGVAVVTSSGTWLADGGLFGKHGFQNVDTAPPVFSLYATTLADDAPTPSFPGNWEERCGDFGDGLTVVRTDQCPYLEDAETLMVEEARARGVPARVVRLESAQEVQRRAPTPFGVYAVVRDGCLFSYTYLTKRQLETAFQA